MTYRRYSCNSFICTLLYVAHNLIQFLFYIQQWARSSFLHRIDCSFRLFLWSFAYSRRIEVSKQRCCTIPRTQCHHSVLSNRCMYLHYSIDNGVTNNFQHKISLFPQKCVPYIWSLCLWLAPINPCPSLWVVHLHYIGGRSSMFTLCQIPTYSPMVSRNSPINFTFYWEFPIPIPINLANTFPSIQWIWSHAESQRARGNTFPSIQWIWSHASIQWI